MNKFKFRAWFKPHLDKGIIEMFEQVEIDCELYFVSSKDKDVKYKFYIPFIDDDWIVEPWTGYVDKKGKYIYDGDIIKNKNIPHIWHYEIMNEHNGYCDKFMKCIYRNFDIVEDKDGERFEVMGDYRNTNEVSLFVYVSENDYEVIGNIHEGERK